MIQELQPSCAPHTDSVLEMRHPPKHMIHTDQLSEALDTVKTSSFTTINTRDASPTVLRYLVFKFCALVAQVVFYAGEAPAVIMPAEKLDD
ncbi:hypothetical protein FDENT_13784 [Fusarium denticulatum]|uniref:Uncharacterized protein n=1 Tax=Fusarium denticulatum TaxID=48507 RepID=A0A8H5T0E7_9HYPO|nr:hypothetical protein FDENT_13784 [Fusarium denticulatum]